jgi:hypothetical protein
MDSGELTSSTRGNISWIRDYLVTGLAKLSSPPQCAAHTPMQVATGMLHMCRDMSSSADTFVAVLRTPALVQEIYSYLPILTDILALTSSSHWTRSVGQSIATQRFTEIVRPFVGDYTAELRHHMYTWGAVITGSSAWQMLTGCHETSNNLNIVVPTGGFDLIDEFIITSLNYRRVDAVTHSNYAFQSVVQSFGKYRHGRLRITLCEAVGKDIFHIITHSPTTADMIFMTPGGIAVFYPEWMLEGVALLNQTVTSRVPGKNVGCIENDRYKVYSSTTFLQWPCEDVCPALWRNVADDGGRSLVLEWDLRYPIRASLARSHSTWRLAEHCGNPVCPFNPSINVRLARLPPIVTVTDHMSTREQEARLHYHNPVNIVFITSHHLR